MSLDPRKSIHLPPATGGVLVDSSISDGSLEASYQGLEKALEVGPEPDVGR
jgi:hypothetical protein